MRHWNKFKDWGVKSRIFELWESSFKSSGSSKGFYEVFQKNKNYYIFNLMNPCTGYILMYKKSQIWYIHFDMCLVSFSYTFIVHLCFHFFFLLFFKFIIKSVGSIYKNVYKNENKYFLFLYIYIFGYNSDKFSTLPMGAYRLVTSTDLSWLSFVISVTRYKIYLWILLNVKA